MQGENVALFDSTAEEAHDFIEGLKTSTGFDWSAKVLTSNQGRKSKLHNMIRYLKYFTFPFSVFLKRKKYNVIVGWQEFYGLIFAFYCRLFFVKKRNFLIVKNFIFKQKKGLIGKIYYRFMRYIVKSKYVDIFICSSKRYCDYCAKVFDEPVERFVYLPFGVNDFTKAIEKQTQKPNDYVLALGRSNRDWNTLIDCFSGTNYQLKIVCDELKRDNLPENITLYNDVWQEKSYEFIRDCKCMIIPILDGNMVAGETVLLQAMSFSKPIIITKPSCLADDYVTHNKTGIIVEKNKEEIISAVKKVYDDEEFYNELAQNSRKLYEEKHSLYSFGVNMGKVILNELKGKQNGKKA